MDVRDDVAGGRARLMLGDCVEAMATMEAESVDAIATDPPYGLEFMGKEWDSFGAARARIGRGGALPSGTRADKWEVERPQAYIAGHPFQAWCEMWGVAALRVLKPGGHLLAFGGTRTYHRLASGLEDAGFEIRDSLHWIYGCLSDDTEILTEQGWRRGVDVQVGERVAAWDSDTSAVTLEPVGEKFLAPYTGPMRVLRNADTDQLVTPNHRVYHRTRQRRMEHGERRSWWPDGWQVTEAADVTRHQPTKLPTAGFADGPGIGGVAYAELLAFIWTEGSFDKTGHGVRICQSPSANPETARRIARLVVRFAPGAKRYDRERVYESRSRGTVLSAESTWFFTGDSADRVRADLPGKEPTYGLLWRMSLAEKVAFLDAAMAGDGSGSSFEQKGRAPLEWFQTLAHLVGWSARVRMRALRSTGACSLRRSSTTEMQARHFKGSYDAHYDGDVWCVSVPTGAFLARRNGLVFVTGNSGFPKSLDVSKAVDAKRGVDTTADERCRPTGNEGRARTPSTGGVTIGQLHEAKHPAGGATYEAETDEAKRWDGWGTALKPAHEPIVLARRPLAGSVAETVLAHGTGALNVGGCRVGSDGGTKGGPRNENWRPAGTAEVPSVVDIEPISAGRWPANVVLSHLQECRGDGAKHTDVLCAPGCPVAELNEEFLSGIRQETQRFPAQGDSGGAARFFYIAKPRRRERVAGTMRNLHPTVKPVELMRWLVRLATPPGGLVLDPFMGSGTTGIAALLEGARFVGVERDAESFETSLQRISDRAFALGLTS